MKKKTYFTLFTLSVVPLLMIILVEAFLHLLGYKNTYAEEDPFLGFQEVQSIFEIKLPDDPANDIKYVTRRSKLAYFNYQEFTKNKPDGGYRIFCFGGSTTYGRPYTTATSFSTWLQLNLQALDPSMSYEVINVGGYPIPVIA